MSGASGPSNTLKLLLNNACALSSNTFTNPTAAVLPPAEALAQITPVVIVLTAPGCRVNGPADCRNLLLQVCFLLMPQTKLASLLDCQEILQLPTIWVRVIWKHKITNDCTFLAVSTICEINVIFPYCTQIIIKMLCFRRISVTVKSLL